MIHSSNQFYHYRVTKYIYLEIFLQNGYSHGRVCRNWIIHYFVFNYVKESDPKFVEFRQLYSKARSVLVLTGAGVSAESGVPIFRGSGGLWRQFNATVVRIFYLKQTIQFGWIGFSHTFGFCSITITRLGILSLSSRTYSIDRTE